MDIIYGTPVRQESTVQYEGTFSFDDSSHDGTVLSVSINQSGCHGDRCKEVVGKIAVSPSGEAALRSAWWNIALTPVDSGAHLAR